MEGLSRFPLSPFCFSSALSASLRPWPLPPVPRESSLGRADLAGSQVAETATGWELRSSEGAEPLHAIPLPPRPTAARRRRGCKLRSNPQPALPRSLSPVTRPRTELEELLGRSAPQPGRPSAPPAPAPPLSPPLPPPARSAGTGQPAPHIACLQTGAAPPGLRAAAGAAWEPLPTGTRAAMPPLGARAAV